ncbi:glycosyltransferase family 4 protein [Salinirubellus salinus]|uniref:Glycosyltransferase family 4 protein n=1 Tax=Salinirubellus salinus TaxID=1364945 RepID=A0A9E7R258_9EURY|nr:glycosyltransferase family 4 protein [Salinirubellus salinus]UWM54380.1 glycosyltransferase family 4 protein [Salinirubellus salinus]
MNRILILNSADVIRKTTDALASGLSARGYEVSVMTAEHPKTTGYFDSDENVELLHYRSNFIPKIRYSVPGLDFFETMRREAKRADAVVVTSAVYLPSLVGTLVSNWYETPTVITIDALPGINWTYGNRLIDLFGKAFVLTLSRVAFHQADRVVGLTRSLEEHLPKLVDESKVRIIPNGIDTDHFRPSDERADGCGERVELLFVGRLSPVKGVEHLLSALGALQPEDREFHLTLVGDGEEMDAYVEEAERLGLGDSVTWTGWVDDVRPYYDLADVLILPSIAEGQPSVLLEAQACGVPVVATEVGGVPNLVGAGVVVPPRDPDAIRDAVVELVREPPENLRSRARAFVLEHYSSEAMIEGYEALFSEISSWPSLQAPRAEEGPAR